MENYLLSFKVRVVTYSVSFSERLHIEYHLYTPGGVSPMSHYIRIEL